MSGPAPLGPAALLKLASRLARSVASARDLDDAAASVLEAICVATGWPIGHLWVLDSGDEMLVPTSVWHLDDPDGVASFVAATEGARFGVAEGIVGRAATETRPVCFEDVRSDARFPRREAAAACGLIGGYAFPILHEYQLVGVLEFFDTEPAMANETMFETIGACVSLLGLVAGREQVRADLHHQGEQIRVLLEGSPEAIVVTNAAGRILALNREAERMFGWRADEIKGQMVLGTLIPDAGVDAARAAAERIFSDGDHEGSRAETYGVTRAGEEFPIECTLWPLQLGRDRYIYGFVNDLSEREESERALRVTAQRLESAIRLGQVGSWELDVETGTLTMSDIAYETVGLKPGDKTIETWGSFVDLMHPDDRDHARLRLDEILSSPGPVELAARVVTPDGTVHLVSARCEMEYDAAGNVVRGYGTTYDVIDGSAGQEPSEWYRVLIGAPRLVEEAGPAKSPEEIIATLYGSTSALQRRIEAGRPVERPQLTAREQEILELLRDGLDAARIAKTLGISIHTVRDHLKRVRQKLGVQSQLQAVVKASSLGLLRQLA